MAVRTTHRGVRGRRPWWLTEGRPTTAAAQRCGEGSRALCHDGSVTRVVDYRALTLPVLKSDVRDFKAATRASGTPWAGSETGRLAGWGCLIALLAGFLLTVDLVLFLLSLVGLTQDPPVLLGIAGIIVPPAVTVVLIWLAVRGARAANEQLWQNHFRLSRFAADNGLIYSASTPNPQYPGLIFNQGSARQTVNHFRSAQGRFFDIGNFQFTTSDGKTTTTHHRGFMALHLDRRLPHMVLDAKSNGALGLAAFGQEQRLSLEGDFDRYFTLYCPRQYERDALYVFTPDLMALLIDEAAPFDVEIVDNWMFVYSNGAFPPLQVGLYERLFRIIDTVGAKTLRQTARYQDDRLVAAPFEANVVAPPGQRLRRRFPPAAIIALIVFGAVLVLPIVVAVVVFLVQSISITVT